MPTVELLNQDRKKVGTVELREDVFAVEVNIPLVHQVLKAQLAGRRQGTAKTKTKGEVRGGGRKPFRQKGTGNARQGSIRSPLQPGGGQNFGPQPRSYEQKTPKEMMRGALRSALSDRLKANRILILDEFKLTGPKTAELNKLLKDSLKVEQVLIVDQANSTLELSGRNLPRVKVLRAEGLNVYDVVRNSWIVFTKKAVQAVEDRLAPSAS